jgi:flagellar biosynthetic protein FliQ
MSTDMVVSMLAEGISLLLLLSLPIVGVGMLVGLVISVFQAVTQIQEQTLTFVPKMIAVFLMFIFTAPWLITMLINYCTNLWVRIPLMVR